MAKIWHEKKLDQLIKDFSVDLRIGLTGKEVQKRKSEFGLNLLPKKKKIQPWEFFLR